MQKPFNKRTYLDLTRISFFPITYLNRIITFRILFNANPVFSKLKIYQMSPLRRFLVGKNYVLHITM